MFASKRFRPGVLARPSSVVLAVMETLEQRQLLAVPVGEPILVKASAAAFPCGIESDPQGNFIATWGEKIGTKTRFSGRLYDAQGSPKRDEFALLEFEGEPLCPKIGMANDGHFVASTYLYGNGTSPYFSNRRFSAGGFPQGAPFSTLGQLDMYGDGTMVSAWATELHYDNESGKRYSDNFAQKFNSNGIAIGNPVQIRRHFIPFTSQVSFGGPVARVSPNGDFAALYTWDMFFIRGGTEYWSYTKDFAFKGKFEFSWDNAGNVGPGGDASTFDPMGRIVYAALGNSPDGIQAVSLGVLPPSGSSPFPVQYVYQYQNSAERPSIIIGPNGNGTISWSSKFAGPLHAIEFSSSTGLIGEEYMLAPATSVYHDLARGAEGEFFVEYGGTENGAAGIYVRRFDASPSVAITRLRPNMTDESDTGRSNSDNVTRNTTPIFSGVAEAGATVTLMVDGNPVATGIADGQGKYSIAVPAQHALADGEHSVSAKVLNPGGIATLESEIVPFYIDTRAPALPTVQLLAADPNYVDDDTVTKLSSPSFKFPSLERDARPRIRSDGLDVSGDLSQSRILATTPLSDGAHALEIFVEDRAGNASSTFLMTLTVDTVPPTLRESKYAKPSALEISLRFSESVRRGDRLQITNLVTGDRFDSLEGTAYFPAQPVILYKASLPDGAYEWYSNSFRDVAENRTTASERFILATAQNKTLDLPIDGRFRYVLISRNAKLAVQPGGNKQLVVDELSINITSAMMDLSDATLVVKATAQNSAALLKSLSSLVNKARQGGSWLGSSGITSSNARNFPGRLTGLVITPNQDAMGNKIQGFESFDSTDIIIKYTWNGDTNLDRRLTIDDYAVIDKSFLAQVPGQPVAYHQGDFNFDGVINIDDFILIDQAFLGQSDVLV
jgi:Bacterial Ig-like domain